MNRLFVKIFLWFWLAMALVWSIFLLPNLLNQNEEIFARWSALTDQRLLLSGWTSLRVHFRGGEDRLAEFVQDMEEREGTPYPYLVTSDMEELAGRVMPQEALETAREAFEKGTVRTTFPERGVYAGRSFETSSGNEYAVVQRLPSPLDLPPASPWPIVARWMGVLLTSGFVCYGLARYLLAPVTTLSEATRQIADGHLDTRVSERIGPRGDELSALGSDFDRMATRIEQLLAAQRQLLSDISHELRSPLARLYVALGLARRHVDEPGQEQLDRIELETERLNGLIGELLSLTRLEAGDGRDSLESVELDDIVREVVADADYEARDTNRHVALLRADPARTVGHGELLRRAVENVIRNAVRYTDEGTDVEVDLGLVRSNGSSEAVIRVRDHGPGVPSESLEHLFEPFYRIDEARERRSGGAGLGLSITRRAVKLHNGDIRARNASDGGLVVEIRLPTLDGEREEPAARH